MNRKKELELRVDMARERLRVCHERYEIAIQEYIEYVQKENKK